MHEVIGNDAGLRRPDMVLQPVHQSQIVRHTAHQAHRGMGVQVDESRDQCLSGQCYALRIRIMRQRISSG